jgi:hypothetical protein
VYKTVPQRFVSTFRRALQKVALLKTVSRLSPWASGSVRARARRAGPAGREACTGASASLSRFVLGSPPRATKVPYRSLAVIVAGWLAILCGYEVAAESFMTD